MKKSEIKLLKNKFKSIELLNSEGCILKAFKTMEGFMLLDEYGELIAILSDKQIFNYTRGKLKIIDSMDRKRSITLITLVIFPIVKLKMLYGELGNLN